MVKAFLPVAVMARSTETPLRRLAAKANPADVHACGAGYSAVMTEDTETLRLAEAALAPARRFCDQARAAAAQALAACPDDPDAAQHATHALAWIATTVAGLESLVGWAQRGRDAGRHGRIDALVLRIGAGEALAALGSGIAMSATEYARPAELGLTPAAEAMVQDEAVRRLIPGPDAAALRGELAALLMAGQRPDEALDDEALDAIRATVRAFAADRIAPHAHRWHLADDLIPRAVIDDMAALGLFGVAMPTEYGGLGLGKLAMAVVSEELSRAWICAGSLGTRSEIAAELIAENGTDAQKRHWLPRLASGEVLPTAVFTEPDCGSDLARVATRAVRAADGSWSITGAKTWITHAARADLMTLLARTDPARPGHDGLSMLLVPKTPMRDGCDFPDDGLTGSDIPVLGYRGMREYALSFDGFRAPADALLGGIEGQGFRQLMRTFEAARIQTAARAVGVAWNACDLALRYAGERRQFGRSIAAFPRVADKIALICAETVIARELTYDAARAKDEGRRCDVEAGMAKLLAARCAWTSADQCVQIHGGNGYALEFEASRVLCDARILSIFEGAAEIQAHVIARALLKA
jgi:(2S)-methylsuccinyl-CoA dehydrogenase